MKYSGLRCVPVQEGTPVKAFGMDGTEAIVVIKSGKAVQSGAMLYMTDSDYDMLSKATEKHICK